MRNPNGWGSVHKLPGNRRNPWRVRLTVGWAVDENGKGKQEYKTLGCYPTKEEAMIALAEYHKNPYAIDNKITFAELYEKWSAGKFPTIDESNVHGYKASYKVCTDLYKMHFNDIRLVHLQEVVDNCGKNYPTLRKLKVLFVEVDVFLFQIEQFGNSNSAVDKHQDYAGIITSLCVIPNHPKFARCKYLVFLG